MNSPVTNLGSYIITVILVACVLARVMKYYFYLTIIWYGFKIRKRRILYC